MGACVAQALDGRVVRVRMPASTDARVAFMADIQNLPSALKLSSQTERSNAEDLDTTQANSDFSNQQTGYDAALEAYSMVQRLSLFNYFNV